MRIVFYIFVLVIMSIFHFWLLFHENRRNGVSSYSVVIFSLLLYVDLVPLLLYLGAAKYVSSSYIHIVSCIVDCNLVQFIWAEIAILLFTLFFHYFYLARNNASKKKFYIFDPGKFEDIVTFFAYFTTIVGGVAFAFYIRAFGGVSVLLSYSEFFRTFRTNNADVIGDKNLLLIVPSRLIIVAPILIWTTFKFKSGNIYIKRISFVIVSILAVVFLLFNSGKTNVILMAICFAIPFLKRYVKHPWLVVICSAIVLLPFLGILDSLFKFISSGVWNYQSKDSLSYIGQFSYVYANILNLSEILSISKPQFGISFITGILDILPGLDFTPAYGYTSQFYYGEYWKQVAGVPIDILTLGYIQFSMLGVPIIAAIFGSICGRVERLATQVKEYEYAVFLTALYTSVFSYCINADIGVLIRSQFLLIICVICMLYSYSDSDRRHKRIIFRIGKWK